MIICFSGFKGSGKDTLAAYLIEKYKAVRVSFADPLKDLVAEEYDIDRASLDDPNRKEKPILTLPVEPKDAFTRMVAEFMYKEFRDKDGRQPIKYIAGDRFQGIFDDADSGQLYHTPRSLAILKGSTNRVVRSDFWVQKAIEKAKSVAGMVVISDLRYKSELGQLKEAFAEDVLFIRVNRFKESPSNDPSERDLDDATFDGYVDNTGSKEESYKQLREVLFNKFRI